MASLLRILLTGTLLVGVSAVHGCGPAEPRSSGNAPKIHDFGMIPHGQIAEATFEIPLSNSIPVIPFRYEKSCSCGTESFLVQSDDGQVRTRSPEDQPLVVHPGEKLRMKLQIDTSLKEAADQEKTTIHGSVILHDAETQMRKIIIPVSFIYGINSPIEVKPSAHVDFGNLPRSARFPQVLELHRDDENVRFLSVETSDPRLKATLSQEDKLSLLHVEFIGGNKQPLGPVYEMVKIKTTAPNDYTLIIPVTGLVVPNVIVEPMNLIGFNKIPFDKPAEKFLIVTDHNRSRDPAMQVLDILDSEGSPLNEHFEVRLEALEGAPRSTRMFLRYLGTLQTRSFRGKIRLCKTSDPTELASIDFVGFNENQ